MKLYMKNKKTKYKNLDICPIWYSTVTTKAEYIYMFNVYCLLPL